MSIGARHWSLQAIAGIDKNPFQFLERPQQASDHSFCTTIDLNPCFRTGPSMISDEGKGKKDVEAWAH